MNVNKKTKQYISGLIQEHKTIETKPQSDHKIYFIQKVQYSQTLNIGNANRHQKQTTVLSKRL